MVMMCQSLKWLQVHEGLPLAYSEYKTVSANRRKHLNMLKMVVCKVSKSSSCGNILMRNMGRIMRPAAHMIRADGSPSLKKPKK